jgi:hypothetical protein
MLLVLLPVAATVILPIYFHVQWLWWLTLPLALFYSGAIYFVVTTLVAPRILKKAPEILAVVAKE